ncbi:MAG: type II secretion system F family protein [Candidatus Aenigmarchaeota archaeon]|nr:type II secretion system F family protein [Candidatus Aenigmarchaeota archaeon]
MTEENNKRRRILAISIIISTILIVLITFITQDVGTIINVGVLCIFIVVGPFFLYSYAEFMWLRAIEREFPNFIRDIANSKASGMTIEDAIEMATKTNYGKMNSDIMSFRNRLTWGVPFLRCLELFGKRFHKSSLIAQVVSIIDESYKSGGDVAAILNSTARDMLILREAEEERKGMVKQHVMIMYGIFFMFLAISLAIIYIMVPIMTSNTAGQGGGLIAFDFGNPCQRTPMFFPCEFFGLICSSLAIESGSISCYYTAIFFTMMIILSITTGLIAGQLGDNSVIAGSKHVMMMLAAVFLLFLFFARTGILPV